MSDMGNFNKVFVERTLKILQKSYYKEEYQVTLLLNLLLALVTLPIERKYEENSEDAEIFRDDCTNKLEELKNNKNYINKGQNYLFHNIRNAIAHLNIKIYPSSGKVEEIELSSYNTNGTLVLRVNISVENLKIFAEYVAAEYLKRFF